MKSEISGDRRSLMELVKGISSDHELIDLAELLDVHLDGVITIQEIETMKVDGTYIILLRVDNGVGHWVAYDRGAYFDPFGVGPPPELDVKSYNSKQFQGAFNTYCGIFCTLWLYSRQKRQPSLMNGFHNLNNTDFENR